MWSLVCEIGLWGWIGATIVLIARSFPSRAVFRIKAAAVWGGCLVAFYFLWIVGMLKS
jgi:hypothetical protein